MAATNTFEIKFVDKSRSYVNFLTTPFHFFCFHSTSLESIQLEISVVTFTLSSEKEIGMFQSFIKQPKEALTTSPTTEISCINYPINLELQNDIGEVAQSLTNYLQSFTNNENICLITENSKDVEHFKKLYADANTLLPNQIKFIRMNELVNTTLKFFKQPQIIGGIQNVININGNIPQQQLCPFHATTISDQTNQKCITQILRMHWYTIHAVLKQSGLNVEGSYVVLNINLNNPKSRSPSPKSRNRKKSRKSKSPSPIAQSLSPICKSLSPKKHNQNRKSKSTNTLTPELRNIFTKTSPNYYIQFVNIEYSYSNGNNIVPLEVGISTYDLERNNECSWYHSFINFGNYTKENLDSIDFHGINPTNTSISFKKVVDVKNELQSYFNQFEGVKFVCVKDSNVRKFVECLKQIFGTIPHDICVVTHVQLFEMICKKYNVNEPRNVFSQLSTTFKELTESEKCLKCEFHETTEPQFRCGLGDSRLTALTIMTEMKNVGILTQYVEQSPIIEGIPTTFNINTNNFLFINVDRYGDGQISEVMMSKVTFENNQIKTCESYPLQYLLHENYLQNEEQQIVQITFAQNSVTSNTPIYEYFQKIINKGDNNQVIVFLDDLLIETIPSLTFDNYLCITEINFLEQFITEVNGSCNVDQMFDLTKYLYSLQGNQSTSHCKFLHKQRWRDCTVWKFSQFKFILEQLHTNYSSIISYSNMFKQNGN